MTHFAAERTRAAAPPLSFINMDNYYSDEELRIVLEGQRQTLTSLTTLSWLHYSSVNMPVAGQLSHIAINLSRAGPSIKLFGIWQLLKGQ